MELTRGTEIFYHGDVKNRPGIGVITAFRKDLFGSVVDIRMYDGRILSGIHTVSFSETYSGTARTRFVTRAVYDDWRRQKLARMQEAIERGQS